MITAPLKKKIFFYVTAFLVLIAAFVISKTSLYSQQCSPSSCNRPGEYVCSDGVRCCTGGGCPTHVCKTHYELIPLDGGGYLCRYTYPLGEHMPCPDGECSYIGEPSGGTCRYCEGGSNAPAPSPACWRTERCEWREVRVSCTRYDENGNPYQSACNEDEYYCQHTGDICLRPSTCQPAQCPSGTSQTGGGPLLATRTCTYNIEGQCTTQGGEKVCRTGQNIRYCYGTFTQPPVITEEEVIVDDPSLTTTTLGCFAQGLTGREVNNEMQARMTVTDPNGASDIRAFVIWLNTGGVPPTIPTRGSGTPTVANNSYGFMVGYVNNQWRVFAPRLNGSTWSWVDSNSAGEGERVRIKGPGGRDMLVINDVSVSDTGANSRRLNARLEVLHSDSGISNWESVTTANYNVYAAALDVSRFFQGSNNTLAQAPQYISKGTWTIDLEPPTRESITQSIVNAQRLNVDWNFSDFSGIKRVVGNAQPTGEGTIVGPISNITSGVSNYEIGSTPQGSDRYSGSNLWGVNSLGQRVELLDIGDNEGDVFELLINPFDNACNTDDYIHNLGLGGPWIITKGGVVFSSGGFNMSVQNLEGNQPISPDPYFTGDFGFIKDEADIGTEVVTSGSSSQLLELIHSAKLGSSGVRGYQDANNRQGYWFNELSRRFRSRNTSDPSKYTHVELGSTTLSGATSDSSCVPGTSCVITVDGNLTVESNFVCDTRAVFLVSGNINVSPNISASSSNSGCMFVASGDIIIGEGEYQSGGSSYPKYDVIDGYFIAEGNIVIPEVDRARDVRDGLVVRGGLVALGTNEARSIQLGRSLKLLDNNNFPTLAIHSDNRYMNFSVQVFGGYSETIKRDVGFKPW